MALTVTAWNIRQGGGDRALRLIQALDALNTDIAVLGEWRATSPNRLTDKLAEAGYEHQVGEPDPRGGYASWIVASKRPIPVGGIGYVDSVDGHCFQHIQVTGTPWSLGATASGGFGISSSAHGRGR